MYKRKSLTCVNLARGNHKLAPGGPKWLSFRQPTEMTSQETAGQTIVRASKIVVLWELMRPTGTRHGRRGQGSVAADLLLLPAVLLAVIQVCTGANGSCTGELEARR